MTVAVAVVAAKTSTGTQDITTADLGGATPKAVLFLYSRSPADGTITAGAATSYGMADGSAQAAVASFKRDDLSSATAGQYQTKIGKADKCLMAVHWDSADFVVHSEAAFSAFIAGGVRVNWTTAAADGWLITALFFSGSDWSVQVGNTPLAYIPGITVTTPWQPDILFLIGASDTLAGTFIDDWYLSTFGATVWDSGSPNSRHFTTYGGDSTHQNVTWVGTTHGAAHWQSFGLYGVAVTRAATSFTLAASNTPTGGGTASTHKVGYMALRYTGAGRPAVGTIRLTEDSGDQAFVGFGGQPGVFAILTMVEHQANNNIDWRHGLYVHTATKGGGFAVGSKTDSTLISGSNKTVHKSTAFEDKFRLLDNDGTENCRGTLASFDTEGFTLNFTNAPNFDAARGAQFSYWEWFYLTILDGGGGGSTTHNQAWIID